MTASYWVRGTVTEERQWQVQLNLAGWWGAWVDVAGENPDEAFEAACEAYVMNGTDSRLMDHITESHILETK